MAELLTTKEIAEYLKLRPETVLRKVKKREIPAIKLGGRFRFDKGEVDDWLHQKAAAKGRILVVDDEEIIRQLFRETLQREGHSVLTAQSGSEALKLIKDWDFDLIFLDLKMPKLNGAETFRKIRRISGTVPIVIITGFPISKLMEEALNQGPFGVMKKPFAPSDIRTAADRFLRTAEVRNKLSRAFQQLGYV